MNTREKLKSRIDPIVALSAGEWREFGDFLVEATLHKNELFLHEGQVCDFIGFVNSGALIYYKTLDNGNEMTTDFAFEGDWVTNNLSRLNDAPSLLSIKALAETEMLILKQRSLTALYERIPKIERLGRVLMEQAFLRIVRQNIDLQVLQAKERYETLLARYPEIFQKVPLYHIANYLGIAPKSLSRIRKEMLGK